MLEAAFWGLVTAGSLWVGAALAVAARPGGRWIGLAMAFGSGALIAAVAYELVFEAFETDLALAFAGGALLVMLADTLMPEAFELGGREAGLLTALGFALGFALS